MSDPLRPLSGLRLWVLTLSGAVVAANAYYIHPIVGIVAADYGVSASWIGAVPALNQIALAAGIFALLPLGDRVSNRRLVGIFLSVQVAALLVMATAQDFRLFVAGSAALGFFTITPYLLPAYASKRVDPERLGHVTALLTTGVIAGVTLARVAAGAIAESLDWRVVYWMAAALMLAAAIGLPLLMDERVHAEEAGERESYGALVASLFPLLRRHPEVIVSGTIQALSFGVFLAIWMGIGLHLTSPEVGYGADTVGYLAGFSSLNLFTTPRFGKWIDRIGPRNARVALAALQMAGVCTLFWTGHDPWWLLLPIGLMSIAGPVIDVTGRMSSLGADPRIRTRLMTLYIVLMFLGAGLASWAGTISYDVGGWTGSIGMALGLSACVVALSVYSRWRFAPS